MNMNYGPSILLTFFVMLIVNLKDFKHFLVALITAFVLLFIHCFLPYILDKILKKVKKDDLKNKKVRGK